MSEVAVKGYTDIWGKHGVCITDHTGPASYAAGGEVFSHPQRFGLRNFDFLIPMGITISGNYEVKGQTKVGGGGNLSSMTLRWYTTPGSQGSAVSGVTITAGGTYTGAAPTVTFAAPTSGTTATGVAILNDAGTAVIGVEITNPGSGYTAAPAVTFGSGGATGTSEITQIAPGEVAAATNLSGETIRLLAIGG